MRPVRRRHCSSSDSGAQRDDVAGVVPHRLSEVDRVEIVDALVQDQGVIRRKIPPQHRLLAEDDRDLLQEGEPAVPPVPRAPSAHPTSAGRDRRTPSLPAHPQAATERAEPNRVVRSIAFRGRPRQSWIRRAVDRPAVHRVDHCSMQFGGTDEPRSAFGHARPPTGTPPTVRCCRPVCRIPRPAWNPDRPVAD